MLNRFERNKLKSQFRKTENVPNLVSNCLFNVKVRFEKSLPCAFHILQYSIFFSFPVCRNTIRSKPKLGIFCKRIIENVFVLFTKLTTLALFHLNLFVRQSLSEPTNDFHRAAIIPLFYSNWQCHLYKTQKRAVCQNFNKNWNILRLCRVQHEFTFWQILEFEFFTTLNSNKIEFFRIFWKSDILNNFFLKMHWFQYISSI